MDPATKVLVVDDDVDFRNAMRMILTAKGCQVVTADGPLDGLEKLVAERPDVLILDVMMDGLFDGYATCHKIKTADEYREFRATPVIMVSVVKEVTGARFNFDPAAVGFRGPDEFLDKPVTAETLVSTIDRLVSARRLAETEARAVT